MTQACDQARELVRCSLWSYGLLQRAPQRTTALAARTCDGLPCGGLYAHGVSHSRSCNRLQQGNARMITHGAGQAAAALQRGCLAPVGGTPPHPPLPPFRGVPARVPYMRAPLTTHDRHPGAKQRAAQKKGSEGILGAIVVLKIKKRLMNRGNDVGMRVIVGAMPDMQRLGVL